MINGAKSAPLSPHERKERAVTLAALLLQEAQRIQTAEERKRQEELGRMINDPIGKVFTTAMTDQCFRSRNPKRVADQLCYLIQKFGIPSYLPYMKRMALLAFADFGQVFARLLVPLTIRMIRKETSHVILPGEPKLLQKHLKSRRRENVRVNLNHLGEAILGEEEAAHRLNLYLADLARPDIEYISIKISTLYSQINLLSWDDTLEILTERLRRLYRAAQQHHFVRTDGTRTPKFVNLDMEEYRDLHLTVALFRKVLDEQEFYQHEAGIVLQSYLPDSFLFQQELTAWAIRRVSQGGAPIKIRIVKGANLAMEQFESALRLWPQAPYPSKEDVDANYKRMVIYGSQSDNVKAVHLGIASHNLFDIAYALLLRAENHAENEICFEMLEGMADHQRQVVQQVSGDMLLYCPAATKEEFQNAVAYLVRRLDENTAPDNFLRHAFDLKYGSKVWNEQVMLFSKACEQSDKASLHPRKVQNRLVETFSSTTGKPFENEPDTDWALPQNQQWAKNIVEEWKNKKHPKIPLVIGGETIAPQGVAGVGEDPSRPGLTLYEYALATTDQVEKAIQIAKEAEKSWGKSSVEEREKLLGQIACELKTYRGDLIGAMMADTGKTLVEGDGEVSEAIDFADYYRTSLVEWHHLLDITWSPKGTVLVTPPWNFPCSIPAGGILAALAGGNCVIFKPAPEAVLVGWTLVQLFWKAGISQKVLQFIACEDDPAGSRLVQDPRISTIVLTGATDTAKLFMRMRPGLDLIAETGGKNAFVITAMADRDLAIKDLLQSAFGHAGQKCSACSLAIIEAEVYDDPIFRKQLRDAASSLSVGSAWNPKNKINPLIKPPGPTLKKGLTQLDEGESWLLEPKQDPDNPRIWSPGIKLGVKPNHFTFQTELFGPVLSLVRASDVGEAFKMMNQTSYGLTAGIHTLDEREQTAWLQQVEAGNCYINRTLTGAIVERQPFGGCKESSFGKGAKAGGPNYLVQFMNSQEIALPTESGQLNAEIQAFNEAVIASGMFASDISTWKASIASYAFYWEHYFSKNHDPSLVRGQDNIQCYRPHKHVVLRGQKGDNPIDLLRAVAAAMTCKTHLELSLEDEAEKILFSQLGLTCVVCESNDAFAARLREGKIKRVRMLQMPPKEILEALSEAACNLHAAPVLANGRLELLQVLREMSISRDYHRYGNLGERENERRHPLVGDPDL